MGFYLYIFICMIFIINLKEYVLNKMGGRNSLPIEDKIIRKQFIDMFMMNNNLSEREQNYLLHSSPVTIKRVLELYNDEKKSYTRSVTATATVSKTYIKPELAPNKIDLMFVGALQKVFQKEKNNSYTVFQMTKVVDLYAVDIIQRLFLNHHGFVIPDSVETFIRMDIKQVLS